MKNQDQCYCKHKDMLPQSCDRQLNKQTDIYEILHSTEVENNSGDPKNARKGPRLNLPMARNDFYVQEYRDIT